MTDCLAGLQRMEDAARYKAANLTTSTSSTNGVNGVNGTETSNTNGTSQARDSDTTTQSN